MGHLIPAGTGKAEYRSLRVSDDVLTSDQATDILPQAPPDLAETLDQGMIDLDEISEMTQVDLENEDYDVD